jgi:glyoxylase-like metal-dependent hydrolase (beta-lactamase superfamily II)
MKTLTSTRKARRMKRFIFAIACAATAFAAQATEVRAIADGTWLLPGTFALGRQPDGNTILLRGKTGLIVMDTGRHVSQRDAILAFAKEQRLPIVAIVNSHWHLDHTSGNEAIKQTFPQARVYASNAVERIAKDVWPKSTADLRAYLDSGKASPELAEDIRSDIHAQSHPDAMKPDVTVPAAGLREIDGVRLDVHLAEHAATEGDVWLFDPRTRIAAAGDLVTLPVPFLDTACVNGWRSAMKEVEATDFVLVIPGHGEPMDRTTFNAYRSAFDAYASCAASEADKSQCAAKWLDATSSMRERGAEQDARAGRMAKAYVDLLRGNGGKAPLCHA